MSGFFTDFLTRLGLLVYVSNWFIFFNRCRISLQFLVFNPSKYSITQAVWVWHGDCFRVGMKLNPTPKALIVSDRRMFAGALEASCRLVYNKFGYELDMIIGEHLVIFKGSLLECLNRGQLFCDRLTSEGFTMDIPINYQSWIN